MIGKCETLPQTLGALHQLVGFCQRGVDLRRQRVKGAQLPAYRGFLALSGAMRSSRASVARSTPSALSTIVRTVRWLSVVSSAISLSDCPALRRLSTSACCAGL